MKISTNLTSCSHCQKWYHDNYLLFVHENIIMATFTTLMKNLFLQYKGPWSSMGLAEFLSSKFYTYIYTCTCLLVCLLEFVGVDLECIDHHSEDADLGKDHLVLGTVADQSQQKVQD